MSIKELYSKIIQDEWRSEHPFSVPLREASEKILEASDDSERASVLGDWLRKNQPCLFGRLAIHLERERYCFLSEEDLLQGDEFVRAKIQKARTAWRRDAFTGKASGFILLAYSESLLNSKPDANTKELARLLCQYYLLQDIADDQIYLDKLALEIPGDPYNHTFQWDVGINYFGAHADGRWWQDHRIPGGIGFSLNSVGHMVKAHERAINFKEFQDKMKIDEGDDFSTTNIESLEQALLMAMRTIDNASLSPSGRATWLIEDPPQSPKCPVELKGKLKGKNHFEYRGWYNTDVTLPADYFSTDVTKRQSVKEHRLYFDYLYDKSITNPDFDRMGRGEKIRGEEELDARECGRAKHSRAYGEEISIEDAAIWKKDLGL